MQYVEVFLGNKLSTKVKIILGQVELLEGICSLQRGCALSHQLALAFTEFTQVFL